MNATINRTPATLAVILAAGKGTRVEGLPENTNKCAFPIRDGVSPALHMANAFLSNGVTRICVTVGHAADSVREAMAPLRGRTDIHFVENPLYGSTGCNFSLARAVKEALTNDIDQIVVVEGDSLFPAESIGQMLRPFSSAAVLVRPESYISPTRSVVAVGRDDSVLRFAYDAKHRDVLSVAVLGENENILGESMDIWTFSGDSLAILKNEYLRYAADAAVSRGPFLKSGFLASLASAGCPMRPVRAERPGEWINMNTKNDIRKAADAPWLR